MGSQCLVDQLKFLVAMDSQIALLCRIVFGEYCTKEDMDAVGTFCFYQQGS